MNAVIISNGWWHDKEIRNSVFVELSKGENRLIILDDNHKYTHSELLDVFEQVRNKMPLIDKVVIVNPNDFHGSGCAWEIARALGISREQAVFLLCDCGFDEKKLLVEIAGFDSSQTISTGQSCCIPEETQKNIRDNILNEGKIYFEVLGINYKV